MILEPTIGWKDVSLNQNDSTYIKMIAYSRKLINKYKLICNVTFND